MSVVCRRSLGLSSLCLCHNSKAPVRGRDHGAGEEQEVVNKLADLLGLLYGRRYSDFEDGLDPVCDCGQSEWGRSEPEGDQIQRRGIIVLAVAAALGVATSALCLDLCL